MNTEEVTTIKIVLGLALLISIVYLSALIKYSGEKHPRSIDSLYIGSLGLVLVGGMAIIAIGNRKGAMVTKSARSSRITTTMRSAKRGSSQ